jgi:hypothetical protein
VVVDKFWWLDRGRHPPLLITYFLIPPPPFPFAPSPVTCMLIHYRFTCFVTVTAILSRFFEIFVYFLAVIFIPSPLTSPSFP